MELGVRSKKRTGSQDSHGIVRLFFRYPSNAWQHTNWFCWFSGYSDIWCKTLHAEAVQIKPMKPIRKLWNAGWAPTNKLKTIIRELRAAVRSQDSRGIAFVDRVGFGNTLPAFCNIWIGLIGFICTVAKCCYLPYTRLCFVLVLNDSLKCSMCFHG